MQIIKAYVLSIGTCATVPCEPCQARKGAALSDVCGVPQDNLIGAYADIVCTKHQLFTDLKQMPHLAQKYRLVV